MGGRVVGLGEACRRFIGDALGGVLPAVYTHTRPSARIPRPSYRAYLGTTVSVGMQRVACSVWQWSSSGRWQALAAMLLLQCVSRSSRGC